LARSVSEVLILTPAFNSGRDIAEPPAVYPHVCSLPSTAQHTPMASPVCSGEQTFTREHDEPGPNNFDGNPVICLGSGVRKLLLQIGGEVVLAALVIGPAEAVRLSLLAPSCGSARDKQAVRRPGVQWLVNLSFRGCLRRLVKLATVRQQIAFNQEE
jgi:hypothetical protein